MAAKKKGKKKKGKKKNVQTGAFNEEDSDYPERFIAPEGTVGFCALNKPYEGQYIAQLRYAPGEEAEEAIKFFDELVEMDDRDGETNLPYKFEEDEDGNQTGAITVRFKQNAGGKKKDGGTWHHRLEIRQKEEGLIGAGSRLVIQFTVRQTEYQGDLFLQLSPRKIKVVELVEFSGEQDDGFWDDDDEYTVKTSPGSTSGGGSPESEEDDPPADEDVDW